MIELKQEYKEEVMGLEDHALTKLIVKYMEELYEEAGIYKVSSKMVGEHLEKQYKRSSIYTQISTMKKFKIITNLDEDVPDQRGATYFALTAILDKVTAPNTDTSNKEEVKKEVSKIVVPVQPEDSPKPKPSAPINLADISRQLETMQAQIVGISKAYTEICEHQRNTRSALENLPKTDEKCDVRPLMQLLKKDLIAEFQSGVKEIKSSSSTTTVGVHDSLSKAIDKLTDLKNPDSFIYKLRDEIDLPRQLETVIKSIPSVAPETDDYKRGLQDGIKLAIEMGLKLGE